MWKTAPFPVITALVNSGATVPSPPKITPKPAVLSAGDRDWPYDIHGNASKTTSTVGQ
jgi:hypothetical protein